MYIMDSFIGPEEKLTYFSTINPLNTDTDKYGQKEIFYFQSHKSHISSTSL